MYDDSFKTSFLGFNKEDVRNYIDNVMSDNQRIVKIKEEEIQKLHRRMSDMELQMTRLKGVEDQYISIQKTVSEMVEVGKQKDKKIENLSLELDDLKDKLENVSQVEESEDEKALLNEIDILKNQLELLNESKKELVMNNEKLETELHSVSTLVEGYKQKIHVLNNQISEKENEFDRELMLQLEELKNKNDEIENLLLAKDSEIENLLLAKDSEIEKVLSQRDSEIEKLLSVKESELEKVKMEKDSVVASVRVEATAQIEKMKLENIAELERIKEEQIEAILKLQKDKNEEVSRIRNERNDEIEKFKLEAIEVKSENLVLHKNIEELELKLAEFKAMEADIDKEKMEIAQAILRAQEKAVSMDKEIKGKFESENERLRRYKREIDELRNKAAGILTRFETELQNVVDEEIAVDVSTPNSVKSDAGTNIIMPETSQIKLIKRG